MNVPVALVVAALAPRLIAESRSESATRHFDAAGAVTVTAGLSILVYAIVDATDAGWGSLQTLGLIGLSAALIAAFIAIERRSQAPLMPFRIFRLRTLTGANVVGLLVGASLFSMFFFITLYMQQVLGYSAIEAGLAYLPLAVTIIIAAAIASQLVTRIGFKPVLAAGMALIAAALVWFSQVSVGGSFVSDILGPSLLAATGLGFAFVTTTIAAVSGVRDQESGLASGLINTSQQIGGALGLAVLATIANSRTDDVMASAGGDPSALTNALTEGFQAAFLGGAVIAVLGLGADAGADPQPRQPRPRRARKSAGGRAPGSGSRLSRRHGASMREQPPPRPAPPRTPRRPLRPSWRSPRRRGRGRRTRPRIGRPAGRSRASSSARQKRP